MCKRNNDSYKTGIYKLKRSDCNSLYNGEIGCSFTTKYSGHTKFINQPYIKSDFTEYILTIGYNYINIQTNL